MCLANYYKLTGDTKLIEKYLKKLLTVLEKILMAVIKRVYRLFYNSLKSESVSYSSGYCLSCILLLASVPIHFQSTATDDGKQYQTIVKL